MNPKITNRTTQAWAIQIQDRYFVKFGSKGQVLTAWSMCGGQLFICRGKLKDVLEKLEAKSKKYTVKLVEIKEPNPAPFYSVREFYELSYRLERLNRNRSLCIPDKARLTPVEIVTVTTLQWNAAWNDSDSETRRKLDFFFAGFFYAESRLSPSQMPLEERLSMFKADKRDRENGFDPDIPF
ncbi:hypothetical protein [Vibrio chagasii]|uniref:Uncharacterized protein n=1 Tax=Vibrio chagasii TaxID=170679 RepID=A0A7Y4DTS2_9VIBR|nr:hypothetical protein [Vibrio chagasii]NOH35632.1 hypothetical protein [Vibrio chagasii]